MEEIGKETWQEYNRWQVLEHDYVRNEKIEGEWHEVVYEPGDIVHHIPFSAIQAHRGNFKPVEKDGSRDLEDLEESELKNMAEEIGISHYWSMNKQTLIKRIKEHAKDD